MKECINEYFIKNHNALKCSDFEGEEITDGKTIYEVIRIIKGKPLFLEEHLERLKNTVKLFKAAQEFEYEKIERDIFHLIKINKISEGNMKILLSGVGAKNNVVLYFIKHYYPTEEQYIKGVKTILYFGERINPNLKVVNMSFRKKVNELIMGKNAYEAILVDNNGFITEGSKSNIFMIKGDTVFTAPTQTVLPGITRSKIIELLRCENIKFVEKSMKAENIKNLDALFISGTSPKVLPINEVDGTKYKSSQNEMLLRISQIFEKEIKKNISDH